MLVVSYESGDEEAGTIPPRSRSCDKEDMFYGKGKSLSSSLTPYFLISRLTAAPPPYLASHVVSAPSRLPLTLSKSTTPFEYFVQVLAFPPRYLSLQLTLFHDG